MYGMDNTAPIAIGIKEIIKKEKNSHGTYPSMTNTELVGMMFVIPYARNNGTKKAKFLTNSNM